MHSYMCHLMKHGIFVINWLQERGVRVDNYVIQCVSSTDTYWYIPLYGYKIVLQVIGVVLALRIRKVDVKGLNDAKEVQRVIYVTGVIVVVLIFDDLVFSTTNTTVYTAIFGLGLAIGSVVLLGFIFIPKVSKVCCCNNIMIVTQC